MHPVFGSLPRLVALSFKVFYHVYIHLGVSLQFFICSCVQVLQVLSLNFFINSHTLQHSSNVVAFCAFLLSTLVARESHLAKLWRLFHLWYGERNDKCCLMEFHY
jgi:hypothetical protein